MKCLIKNKTVIFVEPFRVFLNGTRKGRLFDKESNTSNTTIVDILTFPRYFVERQWQWDGESLTPLDSYEDRIFNRAKDDAISYIDTTTSNAILDGFDYVVDGETLHFSYDTFDQQNFADTANACLMAAGGAEGLPTTIVWNSYTEDGTLKQITLDAPSFLRLYAEGALAHKAKCMAEGGAKKAQVNACTKAMEVIALMDEWGVPER